MSTTQPVPVDEITSCFAGVISPFCTCSADFFRKNRGCLSVGRAVRIHEQGNPVGC